MATQMYNTLFNHPFFATRFNIPESFGRALSYEAQIHCLLCLIDEMAGAAWVSPDEFDDEVRSILKQISDLETKLEQEINNLGDKVEQYKTELTNRINQVNQDLGDRITKVAGDLANYETANDNRVSKVEGDVASLTTRMGDVETRLTTVEGDVSSLKTRMGNVESRTSTLETKMGNVIAAMGYVYGAKVDASGHMTLPAGTKIPVGDLNWWANSANPTNSTYADAIRSRDLSDDDVKGV